MSVHAHEQVKANAKTANPSVSKGLLQRETTQQGDPVSIPTEVREVLDSPGQPLEPYTRAKMESRFGHDFSQIRIHADSRSDESTRAVNALAYTVGQDIVFRSGAFRPKTAEGTILLAHELTHTIQQNYAGDLATFAQLRTPSISDMGNAEMEADRVAINVRSGRQASISPTCRNIFPLQRVKAPVKNMDRTSLSIEDNVKAELIDTFNKKDINFTTELEFYVLDASGKRMINPKTGEPLVGKMDLVWEDRLTGKINFIEGKGTAKSGKTEGQEIYHPKLEKGADWEVKGSKGGNLGLSKGVKGTTKGGGFKIVHSGNLKEFIKTTLARFKDVPNKRFRFVTVSAQGRREVRYFGTSEELSAFQAARNRGSVTAKTLPLPTGKATKSTTPPLKTPAVKPNTAVPPTPKVEPPALKAEASATPKVEPPAPKAEVPATPKVESPAPKAEVPATPKVESPAPKAETPTTPKVEPPAPKTEVPPTSKTSGKWSVKGKGSGILGIAIPVVLGWLGWRQQRAVEKRVEKEAREEGYSSFDSPSRVGWFHDPFNDAERDVSIEKRYNFPVWRTHVREVANSKRPGETLQVGWDIGSCSFDIFGRQEIETRTVIYKKQADGRWVVESGNSTGTPNLNDIVSTQVPDSTIQAIITRDPCEKNDLA